MKTNFTKLIEQAYNKMNNITEAASIDELATKATKFLEGKKAEVSDPKTSGDKSTISGTDSDGDKFTATIENVSEDDGKAWFKAYVTFSSDDEKTAAWTEEFAKAIL